MGECPTKTCFKCGRLGHLVSNCIYKYDKLTCFKCGKKGHKIYDCQILIMTAGPISKYGMEREPPSIENQKRGWMKEEIKRAKCFQCGSVGHLYCTNDHHAMSIGDHVYKSSGRGYGVTRDFFNCSTYNHFDQFNNGGVGNGVPNRTLSGSQGIVSRIARGAGFKVYPDHQPYNPTPHVYDRSKRHQAAPKMSQFESSYAR